MRHLSELSDAAEAALNRAQAFAADTNQGPAAQRRFQRCCENLFLVLDTEDRINRPVPPTGKNLTP